MILYKRNSQTNDMDIEKREQFFGNQIIIANNQNGNYIIYDTTLDVIYNDSLRRVYEEKRKIEARYNFDVKEMGWINCDKFTKYKSITDFVINLPPGTRADKFVSRLVFTKIRSIMPGNSYKDKIGFLDIPVNMPVYLVGLGEMNGKVVSFIESLDHFEETTPEEFKRKISALDFQ